MIPALNSDPPDCNIFIFPMDWWFVSSNVYRKQVTLPVLVSNIYSSMVYSEPVLKVIN